MKIKTIPVGHHVDLNRLNEKSVIVDAGACVGEFIDGIRKYVNCRIIAIEPSKENIKELRRKNVELIEAALVGRDFPKSTNFYKNKKNDAGSVVYIRNAEASYEVSAVTLDDIFKLCKRIDYLKCDIEGAEKNLIETMTQKDAKKIGQISLEFHYDAKSKMIHKLNQLGLRHTPYNKRELYFCK